MKGEIEKVVDLVVKNLLLPAEMGGLSINGVDFVSKQLAKNHRDPLVNVSVQKEGNIATTGDLIDNAKIKVLSSLPLNSVVDPNAILDVVNSNCGASIDVPISFANSCSFTTGRSTCKRTPHKVNFSKALKANLVTEGKKIRGLHGVSDMGLSFKLFALVDVGKKKFAPAQMWTLLRPLMIFLGVSIQSGWGKWVVNSKI